MANRSSLKLIDRDLFNPVIRLALGIGAFF